MKTHTFNSTGEAYDACQCDENIKRGDILLIPSDQVVGIADTWPFAVSVKHGDLHSVATNGWTCDYMKALSASIEAGRELCSAQGWRVKEP